MDPRVILMLKPFQLSSDSNSCYFQVPNQLAHSLLAPVCLLAYYLPTTNPFLLTNRKYLEHKSLRITAPIWLVNAKRTGRTKRNWERLSERAFFILISIPPHFHWKFLSFSRYHASKLVPDEWATTKCHIVLLCNKHWNKINKQVNIYFVKAQWHDKQESFRKDFTLSVELYSSVLPLLCSVSYKSNIPSVASYNGVPWCSRPGQLSGIENHHGCYIRLLMGL